VLTKSFYLLRSFPGRYDNNALWVEEASASGRDGVSSVLVGGNDWASAWAGVSPPEGSNQQEIALRFGVNLVMYTLTGNYKADQVHVPYILERLGQ
ncbi:MAG: N-terminal double-transrane domain protein, partial [Micavibrio sp.]|nr:N-terminal double-transrane domain protein [Micavibrio sp.]